MPLRMRGVARVPPADLLLRLTSADYLFRVLFTAALIAFRPVCYCVYNLVYVRVSWDFYCCLG